MTDDEILTDLETFNESMIHFKEAVDGKGTDKNSFFFLICLIKFEFRFGTYANNF